MIHREVYRKKHGPIPAGWVVHHVDGNHGNNDLQNLIAMPAPLHASMHFTCMNKGLPLPSREEVASLVSSYDEQWFNGHSWQFTKVGLARVLERSAKGRRA